MVWSDRSDPTRIVLALLAGLVTAGLGLPVAVAAAAGGLAGRGPLLRAALAMAALAAALWGAHQVGAVRADPLRPGPVDVAVTITGQPSSGSALASVRGGGTVVLHAPAAPLEQGAVYRVFGRLRPLSPEVAGYYAIQGARLELRASDLVRIGRRGGLWGAVDAVHAWVRVRLGVTDSPSPQRALVAGIAIGDSGALPPQTRAQLRQSGLYHLVAVSGQNVALLMVFTIIGLGLAGVVGVPARVAALAITLAYVLVTGAGPSIVRAGVAGLLICAAWLSSRGSARWHLLAVGAVAVLLPNPLEVGDPGFQLSFAAVVAIYLLVPRIEPWLGEAVAVPVACSLVTAPIVWWQFGRLAVWSVPANVLAAPAVAPILWLGLLATLAGQVAPPLAAPLLGLADLLSAYVLWLAAVFS